MTVPINTDGLNSSVTTDAEGATNPDELTYSYDRVPYPSYPHAQSHPNRLAVVGQLFGIDVPPVESARILELGSANGANIVPMAFGLPKSQCVGVELSALQHREACDFCDRVGVTNLRLENISILDIDEDFGEFDYIIAHGVYSWVEPQVQRKILEICRRNLSPSGLAYISYNVYPGWHLRGLVRDMMFFHSRRFDSPSTKLSESKQLLDFIVRSIPTDENNPYRKLLKNELELLSNKEDGYLFHEHLEDVNDPMYFWQFDEMTREAGLQYVGDTDVASMMPNNLPPEVEKVVQNLASDVVTMEQYLDFLNNRTFRQSILCQQEVKLDRSLSPAHVVDLHIASAAVETTEKDEDGKQIQPAVFRHNGAHIQTNDPLLQAALRILKSHWPAPVAFEDLLNGARSTLRTEAVVDTRRVVQEAAMLAERMLKCHSNRLVEFHSTRPDLTSSPGERPVASELARCQSEIGNVVTSLRHEVIGLNDLARHVLRHLDGERDRDALLQILLGLWRDETIAVYDEGRNVTDPDVALRILSKSLNESVRFLARNGLLMK